MSDQEYPCTCGADAVQPLGSNVVGHWNECPAKNRPKPIFHPLSERSVLEDSSIACAVADAWMPVAVFVKNFHESELSSALDAIELATRESPLRKVKP